MGRVNLDLNEEKLKEVDRLMKIGCISTKKDLFENSLTILRWMMRMRKKGRRVGALDNENNFIELDMPILESAEKSMTEI